MLPLPALFSPSAFQMPPKMTRERSQAESSASIISMRGSSRSYTYPDSIRVASPPSSLEADHNHSVVFGDGHHKNQIGRHSHHPGDGGSRCTLTAGRVAELDEPKAKDRVESQSFTMQRWLKDENGPFNPLQLSTRV